MCDALLSQRAIHKANNVGVMEEATHVYFSLGLLPSPALLQLLDKEVALSVNEDSSLRTDTVCGPKSLSPPPPGQSEAAKGCPV